MTENEMKEIEILQKRDFGYKRIADIIQCPVNAVKSHMARHCVEKEDVCLQCGEHIERRDRTKEKLFCSKRCKSRWWYAHPHMMTKQTMIEFVCPVCGKRFMDYGKRTYCSTACYAVARRKNYDR